MTINIRIITPHVTPRPKKLKEVQGVAESNPDVAFSQTGIAAGPASIEGSFDEAISAPGVVAACLAAERSGIHGVMIDCMGDPGLDAAREAVGIPVVGPGETTMHVAATLGHKFSVVTVLDRVRPLLERNARAYGVSDKLASVRAVEIPVLEIEKDPEQLLQALLQESVKAVTQDHAEVIILGCTGFTGVSDELQSALHDAKFDVPVLNPMQTTVSYAIMLARLGLSHSKKAWPQPDLGKGLKGYTFLTENL